MAERLSLPFIYVRQQAKDHGKGKKIEGEVRSGSKAVVVEDLVSTGGSSIATVESLREAGVKVEDCVSNFTYGMADSREAYKKAGDQLYSLSNCNSAADVAAQMGYLGEKEASEAKKWVLDPKRWPR